MSKSACLLLLCLVWSLHVVARGDGGEVQELEGFAEDYEEEKETETSTESFENKGTVLVESMEFADGGENDKEEKLSAVWDVDEFEGFEQDEKLRPTRHQKTVKSEEKESVDPVQGPAVRRKRSIFKKQESYKWEIVGLVVLLVYLANIYIGKVRNENLALAWAKIFVSTDSLIQKNFAVYGGGDEKHEEILIKESSSEFKFYATGRRYCQGMLVTLDLRSRQDLFSLLFNVVSPRPDCIDIDIYMNDVDMGPMVCLLASPKLIKGMLRENQDVEIYAKEIPVKQISSWPHERVSVWTESTDLFYDLMVPEVRRVFLSDEFQEVYGKYFRLLYITSDYNTGSHKKMIRFSFDLPGLEKMQELEKFMSLIPLMIDLVAEYEPSVDAKKRAEKQRAMESERIWKEGAEERKEAFQQKKSEEHQAEMERVRRMSPEDQQKWREKQEKIKQKRAMKVKTLRA